MSAASRYFRWSALAAVILTALLVMAPVAWAQYTIPDCYVAAINGKFPDEGYAAARDQLYKEDSQKWSADIAGLTAQQLAGYRDYFCANLSVTDTGKDEDGTQHFRVTWASADDYLASIGQRRGSNGGGSSGNSGNPADSTTTGDPMVGSAMGLTNGKNSGTKPNAAAITNPAGSPETLLFNTTFQNVPEQMTVFDEHGAPVDPTVQTEDRNRFLHVSATKLRSIYLTGAEGWTDYAVEARVRAGNAKIVLATRVGDNHCLAYDVQFDLADRSARLERSGSDCKSTSIQTDDDLDITANQWMTLRFEVVGDQLMVFVDGEFTLIGNDSAYRQGSPALILQPTAGKTGVLDIQSLKVIKLHAPPQTLTDYAAAPGVAVAELQKLGQVPSGSGQLIFTEDHAYFTGEGSYFQPLAETAPHTDIVMAGQMTFKSGGSEDDYEDCVLMARLVTEGDVTAQEIEVGFDNDGYLDVYEYAEPDSNDSQDYYTHDTPFAPGQTYHLLFTLIGSQLAAYVDGQRTLVVNNLVERKGSYGLGLTGTSANSRCDGRDVWVYSFR